MLFAEELRPKMLRTMNEQCLFIPVVLLLWCGLFPLFWFPGLELLFSPCVFFGVSTSSDSTFPSSAFFRDGFIDGYCFKLVLLWNVFFSPFYMIYSFSGYTNLDWLLLSLRVCGTSAQALLALRVVIKIRCYSNLSSFICY